MIIIAIVGNSGVGKTSLVEQLCKEKNYFNLINSFTDRPVRNEKTDIGHVFVNKLFMDEIFDDEEVVAKTTFGNYRYCSMRYQFLSAYYNLYIVDNQGIIDLKQYEKEHEDVELVIIRIVRRIEDIKSLIEDERIERDTDIDNRLVDHVLINNGTIETLAKQFIMIVENIYE